MSGPERDDLMDFFDLSKPFKRVNLSQHTGEWQLAQRARQGQRAVREGLLAPAPDQSQEKEAETAEGEWELYQKEVISRLHEQAAASSHANNVVEQSVHPSCMSGAEADTFVDSLSVVPTPGAAPQGREVGRKGIAEAFNMKKHCEETWRLPIHDSKQDILDKVAANQGGVERAHRVRQVHPGAPVHLGPARRAKEDREHCGDPASEAGRQQHGEKGLQGKRLALGRAGWLSGELMS